MDRMRIFLVGLMMSGCAGEEFTLAPEEAGKAAVTWTPETAAPELPDAGLSAPSVETSTAETASPVADASPLVMDTSPFDASSIVVDASPPVVDVFSPVDISLTDAGHCTAFPNGATLPVPEACRSLLSKETFDSLTPLPLPKYLWLISPNLCTYGLGFIQSDTPAACQCQETYNCACVMTHKGDVNFCGSPDGPPKMFTCVETAGVPRIVCPQ
jgi:hypothetical protein